MSELLLYIESNQDPESELDAADEQSAATYFVRANEEVMQKVQNNFTNCPNITPVLCVGNSGCGRSAVLDSILKREQGQDTEAEPEMEDLSYFASDGRQQGVYVWPRPVRLGGVTLLLLKMWGVDFRDSDDPLRALSNKVLSALLCTTSVCLVCTEKGSLFPTVEVVQELYGEVKRALGLAISQFVVFAESEAQLTRPQSKVKLDKLRDSPEVSITRFLFRGDRGISANCTEELCALIGNPELHVPFFASHQDVIPTINARDTAHSIVLMLSALIKVANLDLDYRGFVARIPRFASVEFEQQMQELDAVEERMRHVHSGEALEFFVRDDDSYSLNSAVIETLHREYDLQKPTIVMVIIGNPGMGKSTLLNHIIRVNTGNRQHIELFKTGNTGAHTTRASQVFSQPLTLGGNQLMLMDLEGLGGVEVADERLAVLQANLVSAILTVASVPCILVRNEMQTVQFVEKIVARLYLLKDNFGFQMERVHLLFQDRDLKPGGCDNPQFARFIDAMNQQYFEGRPVLTLRNKPNFSVREKADMCETFLRDLLADSNFPKRNQSGSFANIANLLVEMQYIMGHHNTNLAEIRLSVEEVRQRDRFEITKKEQLKTLAEGIICSEEGMSLITVFNEEFRKFMGHCESELHGQSENVQKHVKTTLESQADLHRLELAQIEYCYRAVKPLTAIELRTRMNEQLDYFYREAWWINTFLERANELKLKLQKIGERYPRENEKLKGVLAEFERKQHNLRNWFLANYGVQIATTAVSGGLGAAAKGATLAASAAKLGIAAVISGAAAVGRFAYSATNSLSLTDTAIELYSMKRHTAKLNRKVSVPLLIESDAKLLVLMVIGTKRTMSSYLLNEFIHHVSPFTSSSLQAFNDTKLTQTLHFSYQRPDHDAKVSNTHGFIIYLRMKKNMDKRNSQIVRHLATGLISRVSLTCMFFDTPDLYAEPILNDAFAPAEMGEEWRTPSFRPKIAVFYRASCRRTSFFAKLMSVGVPNVSVPIERFNEQGLKSALVTVKSEFDVSAPMTPNSLLEALESAEVETNHSLPRK